MKKHYIIVALMAVFGVIMTASTTHAESVRISPLQYQTELKTGEKKKGSVDITNPSNEAMEVKLYVNAFSQVDNEGNLTFFDNEQIRNGLLLDYDSAVIGPRQTLRLFFVADGTKLPTGDVFGVIFAETKSANRPGTNTTARVGTLVTLTNGTPGTRNAEISRLDIPFLQLGDGLGGIVAVKNAADRKSATGFFPNMSVELTPLGIKQDFKGPLVFAGNTRTMDFYVPANLIGFYQVKVKASNAEKTAIVFLVTGWWKAVVPAILFVLIGLIFLLRRHGSSRRKKADKKHHDAVKKPDKTPSKTVKINIKHE